MNAHRKTLQLCRQVAETLNYVLAGECEDDVLRDMQVVHVEPAPNSSQLLVQVAPLFPEDATEPLEILRRLDAASGWLRSEIARAITRRRVPRLLFRVLEAVRREPPVTL